MKINLKNILLIGLSVLSLPAFSDISVIAHPGLTWEGAKDKAMVAQLFKGDKTKMGGTKLVLADNKAALNEFLGVFLEGIEPGKYTTNWAKAAFRDSLTPPKGQDSDDAVIKFVKETEGGVGYVTKAPGAGVQLIGTFSK